MKKVLILLLVAGMGIGLQAQDPAKEMKKAARLLGTYNLDPSLNASKLDEAITIANASIDDPAVKSDPTAWQTYGEIFMTVVNNDVASLVLNPGSPLTDPGAASKAFMGFKMAVKLADKSYQTKDAMKALSSGIQNIYYMGSALYQAGHFADAYEAFKATYDAYTLLVENNEQTTFDPNEHPKALYYSGLCANEAGMHNQAKLIFEQIVENTEKALKVRHELKVGPQGGCFYTNSNGNKVYVDRALCEGKPGGDVVGVFDFLFSIYRDSEKDTVKAEKLLAVGRSLFPEDRGLLFTEINHLLAKGELTGLVSKLEAAIELEPENISIYVTLGQIYDKQFQDLVAEEPEKAEEYFTTAMSYYHQALTIDEKSFDAIYSIGALWYNRAAAYSVALNALPNDYTPAGIKKYDDLVALMDGAFAKALPFFLQAEAINPRDFNTLVALKEIYARQDKFDLVEAYKQKLESLGNQ